MKHDNDLEVSLEMVDGTGVIELDNAYGPNPLSYLGLVRSRMVSVDAGSLLSIRIALGKNFKIYTAKGLKVVVVGTFQRFDTGDLARHTQAWWIDVNASKPEVTHKLTCFAKGNGTIGRREKAPFVFPEPADDYATASKDWLAQEYYCANEGCVAVFVERGILDVDRMQADAVDTSSWMSSRYKYAAPAPIPLEWFHSLESDHGFSYVFEFRNMTQAALHQIEKEAASVIVYESDDAESPVLSDESASASGEGDDPDILGDECSYAGDSNADDSSGDSDHELPDASHGEVSPIDGIDSDDSDGPISSQTRKLRRGRVQQRGKQSRSGKRATGDKCWTAANNDGCPPWCPTGDCCDADDEEVIPATSRWRFKRSPTAEQERSTGLGRAFKSEDTTKREHFTKQERGTKLEPSAKLDRSVKRERSV